MGVHSARGFIVDSYPQLLFATIKLDDGRPQSIFGDPVLTQRGPITWVFAAPTNHMVFSTAK